jgi:hypothetical protein
VYLVRFTIKGKDISAYIIGQANFRPLCNMLVTVLEGVGGCGGMRFKTVSITQLLGVKKSGLLLGHLNSY